MKITKRELEQQKYEQYANAARKVISDILEGKDLPREIYYHLEATQPPKNRDIEICKKEIESWYEEETLNPSLVVGFEFEEDKLNRKLEKLKDLKAERKQFYKPSDENKKILNIICDYPDVVQRKGKLTLERDFDSPRAKLYERARSQIKKYVKKQNEKLSKKDTFFSLSPIDIKAGFNIGGDFIDPLPTLPIKIREIVIFLKKLSFILYPSLQGIWERAKKICNILESFYGIPKDEHIDIIRKYIADEGKETITIKAKKD